MAKPDDYDEFVKKANKDYGSFAQEAQSRFDAKVTTASASQRVSLSQQATNVIQMEGFDKAHTQTVTLDDGSKVFSDGKHLGYVGKDGAYVASGSPVNVTKISFNEDNNVVAGTVLREEHDLKGLAKALDKLTVAAIEVDNVDAKLYEDINSAFVNVQTKAKDQERAENSPVVKKVKELAVQQFGFDDKTIGVHALDNGEIAITSKNGIAIGKGQDFYITPKAQEMDAKSEVALTSVSIGKIGEEKPLMKDIKFENGNKTLINEVYNKMVKVYSEHHFDLDYMQKLSNNMNKSQPSMALNMAQGRD